MSFNADDYETDDVFSLERRPPQRDQDRIWIRNAIIDEIRRDQDVTYLTIRYRDRDQGRNWNWNWDDGPGRGPGRDDDRGPGRGPGRDDDRGPGRGPGPDDGRGPGRGPGPNRDRMQVLRLVVSRQTRIINQDGREVLPRRLREGMRIDALISAAMTRSNPPQSRAFQILIVEEPERRMVTVGRILNVDVRNQFILTVNQGNLSNTIRFNVNANTVILGPDGRRITLQNLFPGVRVRVEHASFMTASIPPQTLAFVIRVII